MRVLDIFFASFLFLLFLPIFFLVTCWNLSTAEHEIFFRQVRIGKNGKEFGILKFATMLKGSENMGSRGFVDSNDFRLLPLGSFFRAFKINELPQLLNVIKGEMSLVGFRPLTRETYNKIILISDSTTYSVKPGITSLASIVLRNEERLISSARNKEEFYYEIILPLKAFLDNWWTKNSSLWNYLIILFITPLALILPLGFLPLRLLTNLPDDIYTQAEKIYKLASK